MPIVDVHQAKSSLSRLLVQAEAGEEIVIARNGKPVAKLVPCAPLGKRQFGALKGKISIGEEFFAPCPTPNWLPGTASAWCAFC